MKKAACALLLLAAVNAAAAVSYRLQGSSGMSGRVLVDGAKVRIDLDNGTVVLTGDSGKTLTLIDPAAKTYTTMSAADLAGGLDMTITNAKSSARDAGDGGTLENFPTRRWLLDTGFDVNVDAAGQKMTIHVSMHGESWRTDKLPEAAASIALGQATRTGVPAIDKVLESVAAANAKGFPLKEVTTIRTKAAGGEEQTTTWTVEVHDVRTGVAAAPAQFAVPAEYQRK